VLGPIEEFENLSMGEQHIMCSSLFVAKSILPAYLKHRWMKARGVKSVGSLTWVC
jgi:hypothetical protein